MGSDYLISNCQAGELQEKGRNVPVCDHVNGPQYSSPESDGFVVDIERLSHLTEKDMNSNSRLGLQRSLARKGSMEKKINPTTANHRNVSSLANTQTAPSDGGSPPEKSVIAVSIPPFHHQITVKNGDVSCSTSAESRRAGRRSSFRRSPSTWFLDPRRVLLFFATLSSVGSILLIYFTLSMGKLNGDDSGLNVWDQP